MWREVTIYAGDERYVGAANRLGVRPVVGRLGIREAGRRARSRLRQRDGADCR